jgi:hypothetical protein
MLRRDTDGFLLDTIETLWRSFSGKPFPSIRFVDYNAPFFGSEASCLTLFLIIGICQGYNSLQRAGREGHFKNCPAQ